VRANLQHAAGVRLVSVKRVPFGVRRATRIDVLHGTLREVVLVVEGAGAIDVRVEVPKTRYAGIARFVKELGNYFGSVDND
jgi:hypothetical protein